MSKEWLKVKNQAEITEIYINGDIESDAYNDGFLEAFGLQDTNIYPLEVKKALDEATGEVHVHINSCGGNLFAGVAISNMLKNHKGRTIAYVDGLAASAASTIAFGCDEIIIPKNAYLMIHRAMCGTFGNIDDFQKTISTLERIEEGIVNTYKEKAVEGVTEEQLLNFMKVETWFTGEQAAEVFNIKVGEETKILNFAGTKERFKNVPEKISNFSKNREEQIKAQEKEKARLENLKKEIEIELALGGF